MTASCLIIYFVVGTNVPAPLGQLGPMSCDRAHSLIEHGAVHEPGGFYPVIQPTKED